MTRYWLHNAFVNIDNEKMSKSLNNGILVRDIVKKVKAQAFRFFVLAAHYRNPLNYSDESIQAATNSLERIHNCVANLKHRLGTASQGEADEAVRSRIEQIHGQFEAKMNDDFNTPDAITALFDLVSEANVYLQNSRVTAATVELLLAAFARIDAVLGLLPAEEDGLLDEEVERLIAERVEARKAKNWARADEIRDLLTQQGILLEDTPQGLRWRRK
jgi:cysteinyl-tRNA synthetase